MTAAPPGGATLDADRLQTILEDLVGYTEGLYPGRRVTAMAVPESDLDTVACHRLVIRIDPGADLDPYDFATRAFEVQRYAASRLETEEYQAIRLLVEPRDRQPAGGPGA